MSFVRDDKSSEPTHAPQPALYAVRREYATSTRTRYYATRTEAEHAHERFSRSVEQSELFALNAANEWTLVKAYGQHTF